MRKGSRDFVSLDLRFWKGMDGGKTQGGIGSVT